MHEKTLLYSALGCTALGAVVAIAQGQNRKPGDEVSIGPVSHVDAKTLAATEIPIRLTSSDGTGLRLQQLRAKAVVEDPLALTEMHLTFQNPEPRVLEGTFRFTLPAGASLSRFAMKVNGIWQEGEVVEKQAARRAYEDFLHKKQDPALMEQGAGNEFSARVFPIPANGIKEIRITYSETLEASAPYVLPLRGLPQLGTLDVDVQTAGSNGPTRSSGDRTFGIHQQRFTPAEDFVVRAKDIRRSAGLRSGDLVLARVVPFATPRPDPIASAIVLVDTSASRGLGLAEQAKAVRRLIAKLPPSASLVVACFDQEVVPLFEGQAADFGEKEVSAIVRRSALGASDFEQALEWAGANAGRSKATRIVVVGDGVATAGETDPQKLKARVERLRDVGITRMDAVAVGGIRDDAFLRSMVRGVLDRDGTVLDAKLGADALARRLSEGTNSGVPVKVEGATWSWPRTLDGLQAGDEVLVYAQVPSRAPLRVAVGTQQFAPELRTSEPALVERAWAQAKIQSLVEAPAEDPASTKREIIRLSTQHRVLSPHTAMLVLESDSDYRRFNIDRNATVDILTIEDGRIAIAHEPRSWEQKRARSLAGEDSKLKGGSPAEDKKDAPKAAAAAAPAPSPAAPRSPEPDAIARDESADRRPGQAPDGNLRGAIGSADTERDLGNDSFGAGGLGLSGVGAGGGARQEGFGVGQGRLGGPSGGAPAAETRSRPSPSHAARTADGDSPTEEAAAAAPRAATGAEPHARREIAAPPPTNPSPAGTVLGALGRGAPSGQVRHGALVVQGGIAQADALRTVRRALPQLTACYTRQLSSNPSIGGHMEIALVIDKGGEVQSVDVSTSPSTDLSGCARGTFRSVRFPAPGTGPTQLSVSFDFVPPESDVANGNEPPRPHNNSSIPKALPYDGRFKVVMERIARGDKDGGLDEAKQWQTDQPGDIMALVALGEAYEARGDLKTAARAYGSILELFSFRADSRRFAGERLERLADRFAIRLAADTYGKAVEQRPDHPASHRLYAFTLLKTGEYQKAFEAMQKGASRSYPAGRFAGADRILKEDLGLVASVWAAAEPTKRDSIMTRLRNAGGTPESGPSLRFVLVWETDANDVDFHIHDGRGGHAYYGNRSLPSGGELYADVTTGYGPECFTIRGPREKRAYPYTLQAHYYSRGPMGYGMGKLEVLEHDGQGHVSFEERPFVVMVDRAYVDLGSVDKPKEALSASLK